MDPSTAAALSLPIVLSLDGVDVLATDTAGRYEFIPRVRPEVTGAGDPTLLLVESPGGGLLQLGVQLDVGESLLAAIGEALGPIEAARRAPDGPAPITLRPAPLVVRAARLLLTQEGLEQVLCEAQPSGLPPYTALLRATLSREATRAVEEALHGQHGRLRAAYDVSVERQTGAAARTGNTAVGFTSSSTESSERTTAWSRTTASDIRVGGTAAVPAPRSGDLADWFAPGTRPSIIRVPRPDGDSS